ncbi:hypothetical protein KA005_67655, partial [bacterium]|nr:hypothetical protein [bacterium]
LTAGFACMTWRENNKAVAESTLKKDSAKFKNARVFPISVHAVVGAHLMLTNFYYTNVNSSFF